MQRPWAAALIAACCVCRACSLDFLVNVHTHPGEDTNVDGGLAGVTVTLLKGTTIITEVGTAVTDTAGIAKFDVEPFQPTEFLSVRAERAGFQRKEAQLSQFVSLCPDGFGATECAVSLHIFRHLEGAQMVPENCTFRVDRATASWQMRAVLSYDRAYDLIFMPRSWDCAHATKERHECTYESEPIPSLADDKCTRKDQQQNIENRACRSRKCSQFRNLTEYAGGRPVCEEDYANQFPKYVTNEVRYIDKLHLRLQSIDAPDTMYAPGAEGWTEDNYMVVEEAEPGQHTVTFNNVPPGWYQIVVFQPEPYSDNDRCTYLEKARPKLDLYLGEGPDAFHYRLGLETSLLDCTQLWRVASIYVGEVLGGDGTEFAVRIFTPSSQSLSSQQMKVDSLDMPTTEEASITDFRVVRTNVGLQFPTEPYFTRLISSTRSLSEFGASRYSNDVDIQSGPSSCVMGCTLGSSGSRKGCRIPSNIRNLVSITCSGEGTQEEDCVPHNWVCAAQCVEYHAPSAASLTCTHRELSPAILSCVPQRCTVAGSNNAVGEECYCAEGYTGNVTWTMGQNFAGECTPIPCDVQHSNGVAGSGCRCADGYTGDLQFVGDALVGSCWPAQCTLEGTNKKHGLECDCEEFWQGNITWVGDQPVNNCVDTRECTVEDSTMDMADCRCADGFQGSINWITNAENETEVIGSCNLAPCRVANSNELPGLGCACLPGYQGEVTWSGPDASGECRGASSVNRVLFSLALLIVIGIAAVSLYRSFNPSPPEAKRSSGKSRRSRQSGATKQAESGPSGVGFGGQAVELQNV